VAGWLDQLLYIPYTAYRQVRWLLGDRSPFGATLKLTTRCTLHCRHCPWLDHPQPDLPLERWLEVIREVRARGARHLVLEGGEPTLRPDLPEIIAYAQSIQMKVSLATNATRPLDAYKPERFFISVDGLRETHDRLRGPGAFDRMVSNLPTARAPRFALVSLSIENVAEIESILEFFQDKVEGFWFSFVYDYRREDGLALSAEEKLKAGERILALRGRYRITNLPSYLRELGTDRACREWLLITVTADGVIHEGCMIRVQAGECRCADCELACHREFSDFIEPRLYFQHLRDYLEKIKPKD